MSAETLADLTRVIPWVQNGKDPALTLDANRAQLLLDTIERARVVGVLDAWAARKGRAVIPHPFLPTPDGPYHVFAIPGITGATPDAARAAAAKAIESGEV